jgi:plasmid maintenance system antidote protein VapI
MKPVEPIDALQRFIEQHGSRKEAADALGVSLPYISDLINGRRDFSQRMLESLGLKQIVVKS